MKRVLSVVIIFCMLFAFCSTSAMAETVDGGNDILVTVNGWELDFAPYGQQPVIVNGRTLLPLRAVFTALGASIEWDGATSTVTAKRGDVAISLQIGSDQLYVNGVAKTIDVPAMLLNDRTMVPVRCVAEAFGCTVEWNEAGCVIITDTYGK